MIGRVYVGEASLHYGDGVMLYTAASGPIAWINWTTSSPI